MREGMRYGRGGKGKYWLPERGHADAKTPLLGHLGNSRARTMSPGGAKSLSPGRPLERDLLTPDEPVLDPEEERLYTNARALEFGDWNYPVINTHYATREDSIRQAPDIITGSTNRNLLQPTRANKQRRKSRIKEIQSNVHQGEHGKHHRASTSSSGSKKKSGGKLPVIGTLLRQESAASTSSGNSTNSQLVDLVVQDHQAEDIERVRARKEGGPGWNEVEQKHYVYVSNRTNMQTCHVVY